MLRQKARKIETLPWAFFKSKERNEIISSELKKIRFFKKSTLLTNTSWKMSSLCLIRQFSCQFELDSFKTFSYKINSYLQIINAALIFRALAKVHLFHVNLKMNSNTDEQTRAQNFWSWFKNSFIIAVTMSPKCGGAFRCISHRLILFL